jgi:molybdate transport system regulatory protein
MQWDFSLNNSSPVIRVRTKVWLELDGQRLIGEGRARLLRLIQETKSINAAAKLMDVSFRRAWAMVKDMEDTLKVPLVEKKRGGVGGGTAILTPAAVELLERYEKILDEFHSSMNS